MHAKELPDLRLQMLRNSDAVREQARLVAKGELHGLEPTGIDEATAGAWADAEVTTWQEANLFFVNDEMSQLSFDAARKLPSFQIDITDAPSLSGICWYQKPYANLAGPSVPTIDNGLHLLTWQFGRTIEEPTIAHLYVVHYASATTQSSSRLRHLHVYDYLWPISKPFDEHLDRPLNPPSLVLPALYTTWLLMKQQVATEERVPHERHQRKRAMRDGVTADPVTRVITLRRIKHAATVGGKGHYLHRWMVRGHWRNQWFPKQKRHVPLWIAPHLKGPDDKPLLTGEKVYALTR